MKLLTPATADDSFWCVVNTYDKTRDSLTPEKLHGIIKPLLLTDTLLDYISFLLIQKKKKFPELIKSAHFVLEIQFMKNIPHISNSKQRSASTHAHSSCRGGFSFKTCLTKFKDYKTQLF